MRETPPREAPPPREQPEEPEAAVGDDGTISIGAKPPCKIIVDGQETGVSTPVRNQPIAAGTHKITLVNEEFGIRETFNVTVKVGELTKVIKDFSDRMK